MTVRELIDKLSICPDDMEVYFMDGENGQRPVSKIEIDHYNGYGPQVVVLDELS